MLKKRLLEFFLTFGYIGKIKYCPGTLASMASFPFMYFILCLIFFFYPTLKSLILVWTFGICLAFIIALFIAGTMASSYYIKHYSDKQDPQEIVIDEVVGQMLTTFLCILVNLFNPIEILEIISPNYLTSTFILQFILFLLQFILFRIFDIFKPWPISYIDRNAKGGLGVMLDDAVAAIFASIAFYIIFLLACYFIP